MIYGDFTSEMISILLPFRTFSQRFPAVFFAAVLALSLAMPAWSDDHRTRAVTFVHATDPHLFVPSAQKPETKAAGEREESLNKKALTDLLQRLSGLSGPAGPPTFLVLTGDLGVDPCDIAKAEQPQPAAASTAKGQPKPPPAAKPCVPDDGKHQDQVQRVAQALGSSPLKEIYLVAGNNDVANEDAGYDSLGDFNKLIAEVQTKLNQDKTGVQLYNLTACYATSGGASSCFADIPNTSYRLIGFPSYSFKNTGGKSSNNDAQTRQFATFRSLLDQARQAGKQVLILSHVPEMDDPFTLAQDRYAAKSPDPANDKDPKNPRSAWSTWNVTSKLLNDWKDVVASDTVVAVLAGHLHDSHKEIYRPPYTWSTDGEYRLGFRKLFLAPPLALKKQDGSPIQARGFSLMTLAPDRVEALLYWYNQETSEFKSDAHSEPPGKSKSLWWRWSRFLRWVWQLESGNTPLRLAVLLIALLTAYLTVVAIWNIPPADNPLAPKTADKTGDQKTTATVSSPFANDFGKTVIAGLSGLAATEVAKSLGGDQSSETRWLYITWFILFFFILLFGLSLLRAFAEGLRAVVAIPRYSLARPAEARVRTPAGDKDGSGEQGPVPGLHFFRWASYWWMRIVHWFFSLRVPALTSFDTLINLIQGKNQTMTRVFADTIIDQQRTVVRTADAIRQELTRLIERRVFDLGNSKKEAGLSTVRVGISVLAADQSSVFYISQSPGSAKRPFIKRSVAFLSVFTGQIRWFKSTYQFPDPKKPNIEDPAFDKIVLFDNSSGAIADDPPTIRLSSYYQDRNADYQAFVMFPFPWPQRGFGSNYVKGAIHISFRLGEDFSTIWRDRSDPDVLKPTSTEAGKDPAYPTPNRMLEDWCDPEVRAGLINSLAVLGELLRGFNQVIYNSYIAPGHSD